MASLNQLLAAHAPLLWIDAASSRIQVGWLAGPGSARWGASPEEAGVGVFRTIESLGINLADVRGFVFCDGPGSILGIRTAAMALRTWTLLGPRPVFAYCSLALVAHALGREDVAVIADARRGLWHHYRIGGGLRRVAPADLEGGLVTPAEFRHWSPLPAGVSPVNYVIEALHSQVADADLFHATEAPDAFLHEEPRYATWTPQVHRAPSP
jgi:tRNA threonylcarbamoyladenosine biosynthesis protein TsaB